MSEYPASSDAEDWRKFASAFGLVGLAGFGAAWAGHQILHGWIAPSLSLSSGMFAAWLELVGLGIGGLMLFAAVAGAAMARQRRGGVEVTADGVRRIYAPGQCRFVAWDRIAGYRAKAGAGVELVDAGGKWLFTIPNSIVGYRDCVAEVRDKGVRALPPKATGTMPWEPKGWKEKLQSCGVMAGAYLIGLPGEPAEYGLGLALSLAGIVWIWADNRNQSDADRKTRWRSAALNAAIGVVVVRAMALVLARLFPHHH